MSEIALVFPGQGSQYMGMCHDFDLIDDMELIDKFNIASKVFNVDFLDVCKNGPNEKLSSLTIEKKLPRNGGLPYLPKETENEKNQAGLHQIEDEVSVKD